MQQKTSNLIARAKILTLIRKWFEEKKFIEVETPILVNCPDLSPNFDILETKIHTFLAGAQNLEPLQQIPNSVGAQNLEPLQQIPNSAGAQNIEPLQFPRINQKYLITSPEFSMKKLLSLKGLDNIYTITKVFRDKEEDTDIHNIEFTMLEWYRKNTDYRDIMRDTEELVKYLFFTPFFKRGRFALANRGDFSTAQPTRLNCIPGRAVLSPNISRRAQCASTDKPNPHLTTSEKSPCLRRQAPAPLWKGGGLNPFPSLKVSSLFKKYAHINNVEKLALPVFKKIVHSREYSKDKHLNYEQCFNLIFLNEIDPKLPKTPFFLIDYPAPLACLAKLKKNNPYIAERFELYINGIELCNGFSELTDGKEQLARFKKENLERRRMGKHVLPIDYELCEKLNLIKKASGNALGIDRLVMLVLSAEKIGDVMY